MPGRILTQSGLDDVAEDGFINFVGVDACAADGFGDDFAAEFDGREAGQAALKFSDGRATAESMTGVSMGVVILRRSFVLYYSALRREALRRRGRNTKYEMRNSKYETGRAN